MAYIDARIKGCGDDFETHDCITCSRNPGQCEKYRYVMGLDLIYEE